MNVSESHLSTRRKSQSSPAGRNAVWATAVLGLLACLAVALPSERALAGVDGPSSETVFDEKVPDGDAFEQFGWPARGRFDPFPEATASYVEFNRWLWEDYGIVYLFAPTIMAQLGTQGGPRDATANYQHQVLFAKRLVNDPSFGKSYFVFQSLYVDQLTRTTGAAFAGSLGINYFTSDSGADANIIKSLLWRHETPTDLFTIQVGHAEITNIDNGCRYACDDTGSFFSSPLSSNPARTLPGQGPAILADLRLIDGIYAEAGIADARGDGQLNFGRVFRTGEVAYGVSLRAENPFSEFGDGLYKVTYYRVDATGAGTSSFMAASEGFSLQFDQDFGDVGVFAKYSRTFGRKGAVEESAAGGLVWKKPFGYDEDWLGVGFGWVDPTAARTRDEFVSETFYRMQLTPFIQLTGGAMLVINPSTNRNGDDLEGVFSLRASGKF